MDRFEMTAWSEWRRFWPVAVASAFGYSMSAIHAFSLGAFMGPLHQEFGWSRSQISAGLTVTLLIGAAFSIPVGMLVDRVGPRRLGIIGAILITTSFALLGTATGGVVNWLLLWTVLGFATLFVQPTIWTKAVASCFVRSRGFAFAFTLVGTSIGATIFPVLATWLITSYGWRIAFPAFSGIWACLALPLILLFFRVPYEHQAPSQSAGEEPSMAGEGLNLAEALRTFAFYKLLLSSGLTLFSIMGITVHFVPLLISQGLDPLRAATVASLIGIFSIIGRLSTGFLLDRLPSHIVGATVFLLPAFASMLLLVDGTNPTTQTIAAASFGLALGAEVDVIAYLTTRYMGIKHFGVLFGAMVGTLTLGGALGPLAAGAAYDWCDSYGPFLKVVAVAAVASSLALATLGRSRYGVH